MAMGHIQSWPRVLVLPSYKLCGTLRRGYVNVGSRGESSGT
jgi:hypothetical protein